MSQAMNNPVKQKELEVLEGMMKLWLETKPEAVKEAFRKYPPGTKFMLHGVIMHVIAYDEYDDGVSPGITDVDPTVDYELAYKRKQSVCPCCEKKLDELIINEQDRPSIFQSAAHDHLVPGL